MYSWHSANHNNHGRKISCILNVICSPGNAYIPQARFLMLHPMSGGPLRIALNVCQIISEYHLVIIHKKVDRPSRIQIHRGIHNFRHRKVRPPVPDNSQQVSSGGEMGAALAATQPPPPDQSISSCFCVPGWQRAAGTALPHRCWFFIRRSPRRRKIFGFLVVCMPVCHTLRHADNIFNRAIPH